VKASEYVKLYREWQAKPPMVSAIFNDTPPDQDHQAEKVDLVIGLAKRLIAEFPVIATARKAQTPEALDAIVNELRQRWKAIGSRIGDPYMNGKTFDLVVDAVLASSKVVPLKLHQHAPACDHQHG
jgi:hypothetical protein